MTLVINHPSSTRRDTQTYVSFIKKPNLPSKGGVSFVQRIVHVDGVPHLRYSKERLEKISDSAFEKMIKDEYVIDIRPLNNG